MCDYVVAFINHKLSYNIMKAILNTTIKLFSRTLSMTDKLCQNEYAVQ